MAKQKDITGQRFGNLTAISFIGYSNGTIKKRMWLCKCDCGNQKTVILERLTSGNTSSCGCLRKEFKTKRIKDLTGKKVGFLTVIKDVGSRDYNGCKKRQWLCKCDCGNESIQDASVLSSGKRISCGCIKSETAIKNSKKSRVKIAKKDAGFNIMLNSYKRAAKKRNLEWKLEKNEVENIFLQNCHYCGLKPSNKYRNTYYEYAYSGIDRKNNSIGYLIENCVPCCKTCNHAKATMGYEEFLTWIENVYKHQTTLLNEQAKNI